MSSLDRLPHLQAQRFLTDVQETQVESKASQRTSGRSGQLSYQVANVGEFDLVEKLPVVSAPNIGQFAFQIDFEAEADWPIVMPIYEMYVNGTTAAHRVKPDDQGTPRYRDPANQNNTLWLDAFSGADLALDVGLLEDARKLRWRMEGYYSGDLTYYLKTLLRSTTPGTLTVKRAL